MWKYLENNILHEKFDKEQFFTAICIAEEVKFNVEERHDLI